MVVAADLREESLTHYSSERSITLAADVVAPSTGQTLVEKALSFGTERVDVLFNNAGIALFKPAEEYTDTEWSRVIDVNLNGAWFVASAVGRQMIAQRGGAILNTASGAGLAGISNGVAYVASKHGLVGMTRALAVEWGRFGIRVNALAPGFTSTEMSEVFRVQSPDAYAARARRVPLGRSGQVEEQAAMALFLNSEEASYVSGLIAAVDGGTHALSAGYLPPALGE